MKSNIGNTEEIRRAIQSIALRGFVNDATGAVKGTNKIVGFVAKIHKDGELAGTVDVQEYNGVSLENVSDNNLGYHEGVYLSAIQNNKNGMVIIPKLYSEVVVSVDSDTLTKYVTMFSHVDIVNLESHETVTVGVSELEEFNDNSPDVDELEKTGKSAKTIYDKSAILSQVEDREGQKISRVSQETDKIEVSVGDDKGKITVDENLTKMSFQSNEVSVDGDEAKIKHGSSSVTVSDNVVYVGSKSNVDDAVLGSELATILSEMLSYISQIITPTLMGPQIPVNVASFISLKAKIEAFKNSHSGFLTSKVQIQK